MADPLDIFYDFMVEEIREICSGEASVGERLWTRRRFEHAAVFGRNDVTMTRLQIEEHAFHTLLVKLTASVSAASPDRLSSDQRLHVISYGNSLP